MLPTPGAGEILLILLLVFIVFFGEKVGALGDAIGKARDQFRRGQTDDDRIAVKRVEPAIVTREADAAPKVEASAALPDGEVVAAPSESRAETATDAASTPASETDEKSGA